MSQTAPPLVDHVETIVGDNGKPYATLTISSVAPTPQSLPFFLGNRNPVEGIFSLNLEKVGNVKSITSFIRGHIITSFTDLETKLSFVNERKVVWQAPSDAGHGLSGVLHKGAAKLQGVHSWPISMSIPDTITLTEKESQKVGFGIQPGKPYALPPVINYHTRWSPIVYEVGVEVDTGSLFTDPTNIAVKFGYLPFNIATLQTPVPQPELKLVDDYLQSPEFDIDGGKIKATIAIPASLIFHRGQNIPLKLTLSNADNTIDLAEHPLPVVEFHRLHKEINDSKYAYGFFTSFSYLLHGPPLEQVTSIVWKDGYDVKEPEFAESGRRIVYGEIPVPRDIAPSYVFGDILMQYLVDVYAPGTTIPESKNSHRLARVFLTIKN